MQARTHQTVKLSRGRHASPGHGACVMELASMLAGERFSDHPDSVCPVIASLLRTYNDILSDGRRQDLYGYAAAAVGTRSTGPVQQMRMLRTARWAAEMRERRLPWSLLPARLRRLGLRRVPRHDSAGELLQRALRRHTPETHAAVLALVDELIALGAAPAGGHMDRATGKRRVAGRVRLVV